MKYSNLNEMISQMRHNKTIDIMGNIIDSLPEVEAPFLFLFAGFWNINVCDIFSLPLVQAKDKDRAKRKRRVVKPEEETTGLSKRKRRRRLKTDSTEISQYEEVVHSSSNQNQNSGSVIYEETVPMSESEQVCSENKQNFNYNWIVPRCTRHLSTSSQRRVWKCLILTRFDFRKSLNVDAKTGSDAGSVCGAGCSPVHGERASVCGAVRGGDQRPRGKGDVSRLHLSLNPSNAIGLCRKL